MQIFNVIIFSSYVQHNSKQLKQLIFVRQLLLLYCTLLEKDDYIENLHVLSCSGLLKSFLLISCVFWIFFQNAGSQLCFRFFFLGGGCLHQSLVGVIALKWLRLICFDVAVSRDSKYHASAILHVLVKLKSVKMATSATVVRLHAGHVRGETSPGSRYVMKEWTQLVLKLLEMQGKCAVEKFEPLFVGHAVILEEVLWKQVALYTSTFFWNYTFNKMLI